jgi:hypothetical protein
LMAAEWVYPTKGTARCLEEIMLVGARGQVGIVVVANGVDRAEADRLRKEGREGGDAMVVSRNADGTYRVTRGT